MKYKVYEEEYGEYSITNIYEIEAKSQEEAKEIFETRTIEKINSQDLNLTPSNWCVYEIKETS